MAGWANVPFEIRRQRFAWFESAFRNRLFHASARVMIGSAQHAALCEILQARALYECAPPVEERRDQARLEPPAEPGLYRTFGFPC